MHVAEPLTGGDTANLIHSSMATDTRQHIPSLLLQPIWRAEHLKLLRVKERVEVATVSVIGKFNLPKDGHNGEHFDLRLSRKSLSLAFSNGLGLLTTKKDFEELASELEKPSTEDLVNFARVKDEYRLNMFWRVFSDLYEMVGFQEGRASQNQCIRSAKSAVHCLVETILPYVDDEGSLRIELNSIPFHLRRIAVKGVMTCDGCIIKTDMEGRTAPLPVAAFSMVRPKEDNDDIEAQEASQLVLQAALAYEEDPQLNVYKSYVIHIHDTSLQVVSADIPRVYLERLYQGEACSDGFEVLHSTPCDMMQVEGRREALRTIFGLLKSLRSRPARRPFP